MIYSNNGWDPLKEIVVGSATNAHWPTFCPIFRKQEEQTEWKETLVPKGLVPQQVVDEANEDLENLSNVLISLGVKVYRPTDLNFESFDGMYNYCPRDRILIVGDMVISAPMLYPTRSHELSALNHIFSSVVSCDDPNAIFDAANICRINNDLLFLESRSGNIEGANWLQKKLGNKYRVHVLKNTYNGVHIDSTIVPIREGLVVLNSTRINSSNIPTIFKNWDIIWVGDEDVASQSFYNYPYASKFIALNVLSVNPNLVICDPKQSYLRFELERHNVETIGVDLRHSRTLGGGHHCVTLDLLRTS